MKSPWRFLLPVAAIIFLRMADAKSDEPGKAQSAAADSMRGKEPGEVRDDNGLKMKLVWCPPGFVTMEQLDGIDKPVKPEIASEGNQPNDDEAMDGSNVEPSPEPPSTERITPVKVFLTQGYWLGKYEVSQSEWKQVMKTEPWKGRALTKDGPDFPATWVSWNDAVEFCRKLTEQERHADRLSSDWEYTLPTEAQWERACRARTETTFSFGDDQSKLGDYAWFDGNASNAGEQYAHRVGQKKANAWGLHDMHGNVWEWCRDLYTQKLPGERDPDVRSDDKKTFNLDRVRRGGGWSYGAADCRSGNRSRMPPGMRYARQGFRPALCTLRPDE
jgi:formylglycine-generating enzyme required for sulfatase activity